MNPIGGSAPFPALLVRGGGEGGARGEPASGTVETLRPVAAPERVAAIGAPTEDGVGADARRRLAAALRAAARQAIVLPGPDGDGVPQGRKSSYSALAVGAMMSEISRIAALPVLPEPASPARAAFAEAVLAMRTGFKRDAATMFGPVRI